MVEIARNWHGAVSPCITTKLYVPTTDRCDHFQPFSCSSRIMDAFALTCSNRWPFVSSKNHDTCSRCSDNVPVFKQQLGNTLPVGKAETISKLRVFNVQCLTRRLINVANIHTRAKIELCSTAFIIMQLRRKENRKQ